MNKISLIRNKKMDNKNSQSTHIIDSDQLFNFVILVVALLCLLFVASKLGLGSKSQKLTTSDSVQIEKTNVDFSKVPEKFPTDIPIEAGAKITQNFNATTPTGQFQATRVFETKKSLPDNLVLYSTFLKKNNWTIKSTIDNDNFKMVIAGMEKKSITVSIDENKTTKVKTVNISYTENR